MGSRINRESLQFIFLVKVVTLLFRITWALFSTSSLFDPLLNSMMELREIQYVI